jgi:pimeloyl-ACP methyl ester carboxylesterase
MPTICINNLDHYYEQTGEGPVLVFIHGAFADARIWEPQWDYFSSRYRLVRYDLRGHGRTGASGLERYTITTFADDLAYLLDALGISSPFICGLSMGGVIAQAFATRHPERSRALVLASSPVSASLTPVEKLVRYVLFPKWVMRLTMQAFSVEQFTRFSFGLARFLWGKNFLSDVAREYMLRSMLQVESNEYLKIWESFYSFDMFPLEKIACPTLVFNGEYESKGTYRHTAEILRRVPKVEARVVPAASHGMSMENPLVFNQFMEEFLPAVEQ